MRLAICMILTLTLFAYLSTTAQKITIKQSNTTLEKVFDYIHKQTAYDFFYDPLLLKKAKPVSLNLNNATLEQVLDACFNNQPFTYIIRYNTILIRIKDTVNIENTLSPPLPQHQNITGKVMDENGNSVNGASVILEPVSRSAISNETGFFALKNLQPGAYTIAVSYIGYTTYKGTINVENNDLVLPDITLHTTINSLAETVVIGYGTQTKRDLTGSLSQVKNKDITAYPSTNIMQSLLGRAAGVQVIQNSGAPNSAVSLRIRGTNSIQGSSEPLYVVDGFPIAGNPSMLTNADIETIDILKDASATAIYGSRGANGVVIITTKKGKNGITHVNYEGSYSVQTLRKKLQVMTPVQYGEFYNEYAKNVGLSPYFTDEQIQQLEAQGSGTDWQNVVMHKAPMQTHTLTISGGNEKTQFSLGAGILKDDGIVRNSYYNRYTFRGNLNHQISNKFSVEYTFNISRIVSSDKNNQNINTSGRGAGIFSGLIEVPSSLSPYNANGTLTNPILQYPFIANAMINPLNYINYQTNVGRENRVLSNAAIVYKPVSGFTIRLSGGIENADSRSDSYTSRNFVRSTGVASVGTAQYTSLLNENTITYDKKFGNNHLNIVGGVTWQNFINTSVSASGSGFVSDEQGTDDLGAAAIINTPGSSYSKSVLVSYLGRAVYVFKQKYLLTASFRADGASLYSEGNKWGYFPSAALGWRISQENFMKRISFLSDLKIRASFGATGSQAISPYSTFNLLSSGKTVFGNSLYTTYAPGTRLASNLKWETTYQTNFGFDASLFKNRIRLTADYYIKNTKDLLNTVQLPSSMGYLYIVQNIGDMQNKGFELAIDAEVIPPVSSFRWNVAANISFNKNKVVKLYNGQDINGLIVTAGYLRGFANIVREGQPLGIFYGYVEDGYDDKGNIAYKDLNKDGVITATDETYIGNPNPKYGYSFTNTFFWKGLELNVYFQGTKGNDIYNVSSEQQVDLTQGLNLLEEQYVNHWTPENTHAKYPALIGNINAKISNRYVEDGSYLRLKNIQLAYNLPVNKSSLTWLKTAQVYISGQNLVTWTKYSWFDPEISSLMSSNSINLGIDFFGYPTAKTITAGIRIGL